ncbi:MAG: GlsB/YeaQ/YmgE family stress response membrane protein [Terracidiphilus sp.]
MEEKGGGTVVGTINDEVSRSGERVHVDAKLTFFSGRKCCVSVTTPPVAVQFEGIGAGAEDPAQGKRWRKRYASLNLVRCYRATVGLIAKSVMHEHMSMLWTIVLGIVGSLLGGGVTHILFRSKSERYHPAGLIFSTLGAILILFICYKLKIHLP